MHSQVEVVYIAIVTCYNNFAAIGMFHGGKEMNFHEGTTAKIPATH